MGSATHGTVHQVKAVRAAVRWYSTGRARGAELVGFKVERVHHPKLLLQLFVVLLQKPDPLHQPLFHVIVLCFQVVH
jgi:hypothetical protein